MSGPLALPGRSMSLRLVACAFGLVTACVLAGCASAPTPTPSASPTKAAPSVGPTSKPTPTPTFAALKYTCNSILPPATLAVFKSKRAAGFTLQDDYLVRMQNIGSNVVAFSTYGGILCQWSYPDSSSSVDYAFSPITSDQAQTQEQELTSAGYVGSAKDTGTLYANADVADYPDEYLFINGYWLQASSDSVMQLLVDNVFVTPN